MADLVLNNCQIWHGGYDLSGKHNSINIKYGCEIKDKTAFNVSSRSKISGLTDAEISGAGFWDAASPDKVFYDGLGVDGQALSVSPSSGGLGQLAYMLKGVDGEYVPGAPIGDLLGFDFAAYGQGDLVRGIVMENATRTATGTGTARSLDAVLAGQKVHAALHIFSLAGTGTPTLTVTIDSHDANVWDGSETERFAFTAATAIGAQWMTIDGPITDTWWRVSWTISGTNPSIAFALVLGIK